MCEPISMALASFAMTAGSALTSYSTASENAKTQNLANAIGRQNAAADFARQDAALGKRQRQEAQAASAKKADVSLEAQRVAATNTVAAGEAGITGPTVDSLMREIYAQEGRYGTRVDQSLDWTQSQIQDQKTAASYQMKDRVNSFRDVQKPSFLDTGLKIAGAGLDAFGSFKSNSKKWGE